jgi:hypothetical protein
MYVYVYARCSYIEIKLNQIKLSLHRYWYWFGSLTFWCIHSFVLDFIYFIQEAVYRIFYIYFSMYTNLLCIIKLINDFIYNCYWGWELNVYIFSFLMLIDMYLSFLYDYSFNWKPPCNVYVWNDVSINKIVFLRWKHVKVLLYLTSSRSIESTRIFTPKSEQSFQTC